MKQVKMSNYTNLYFQIDIHQITDFPIRFLVNLHVRIYSTNYFLTLKLLVVSDFHSSPVIPSM